MLTLTLTLISVIARRTRLSLRVLFAAGATSSWSFILYAALLVVGAPLDFLGDIHGRHDIAAGAAAGLERRGGATCCE